MRRLAAEDSAKTLAWLLNCGRTKRKVIAVVQHAPVPSEIRPEGEQFGWWKTMAAHALHVMAARPEWFTIAEHTELYDYSVGLTDEGRDVARDAALEREAAAAAKQPLSTGRDITEAEEDRGEFGEVQEAAVAFRWVGSRLYSINQASFGPSLKYR